MALYGLQISLIFIVLLISHHNSLMWLLLSPSFRSGPWDSKLSGRGESPTQVFVAKGELCFFLSLQKQTNKTNLRCSFWNTTASPSPYFTSWVVYAPWRKRETKWKPKSHSIPRLRSYYASSMVLRMYVINKSKRKKLGFYLYVQLCILLFT